MILCSCIAERTIQDCINRAKKANTALIEHRIDHLDNVEGLHRFYHAVPHPVIATMRPVWEGGKSTLDDDERMDVLSGAIRAGCAAIDVELRTTPRLRAQLMRKAERAHAITIVSHHDFSGTPPMETLEQLLDEAVQTGANIAKLVTTAHTPQDCARIEALMEHGMRTRGNIIAFAMGDAGTRTRASALILGAPFMYVSSGDATAPGQVDAPTLLSMVERCTV
jgi:3-dehydroquinate dehydratase type I